MTDTKKILIFIIIGLVVFAVGGGAGVLYQQEKEPPAAQLEKEDFVKKALSSKLIPLITAYGLVSDINGKDIILTSGGDSIKIKIRNDAPVYLFESLPDQKKGRLEDLKKGDSISVNLKFLENSQIEGLAIVLIASAKK